MSGWGSENDMRIVDAKYDEYALIYTIKTNGDFPTVVTKLYGKYSSLTIYATYLSKHSIKM